MSGGGVGGSITIQQADSVFSIPPFSLLKTNENDSSCDISRSSAKATFGTGSISGCKYGVGLNLPNGVSISKLECSIFNNTSSIDESDPGNTIHYASPSIYIGRTDKTGDNPIELAHFLVAYDSSNVLTMTDDTIDTINAVVDNVNYNYTLEFYIEYADSAGDNLRYHNCQVSYQY